MKLTVVVPETTGMVNIYNIFIFQWYISKDDSFNGIYLKMGSFDGMDPILPNS